ncbi:hypothetical protein AX15_001167 [Amanita polypyramis BW_CC]|nr:hypothetical protein AX15_001167 [Amanita polypyramis BW_CC]
MPSHPAPSLSTASRARPVQQPLSRRLLFPTLPPDASYPPLFSASGHSPELAAEIYDFIALALRAYVSPWWSKISRYDKEFIPEVNCILVHLIQTLEARLHGINLPHLLLCDVPVVLTQHYRDYRNAASKLSTSYADGGSSSLSHLFHQLQPHMALSADGKIKEDYYRQILDRLLQISLPPEDYAAEPERYIIREAILKVVLVDIFPKVTQPWFVQLSLLNLLGSEDGQVGNYIPTEASSPTPTPSSPSSYSFLILLLSTVQKLSGASLTIIHAYKQAVSTIKSVNQLPQPKVQPSLLQPPSQNVADRRRDADVSESSGTRERSPSSMSDSSESSQSAKDVFHERPSVAPSVAPSQAIVFPLLILFSEVFNTAERLAALIITTTLSVVIVLWTSFLDRLVPHLLMTSLSSTFILNIVRLAKRTLFPSGYPAPSYEEPTSEEQAAIRAKLVGVKPTGILAYFSPIILGPDPGATLDSAIEPLCDPNCNLHLVVIVLDRILVGLFPELIHPDEGLVR